MMEQPQQVFGFALSCDLEGKILQVISDGLGITGKDSIGNLFAHLMVESNTNQAADFLMAIRGRGNVFDYELNARLGINVKGIHLVGTQTGKTILIMGALSRSELIRFCWWLGKSQAIHAEALQNTLFGFALQPDSQKVTDNYLQEDLARPANDLTELQRELVNVKAELKKGEELFRGLFEQGAVGVCYSDLSGKFIRFNQRFCDILGYEQQELLGRHFRDITNPDDLEMDSENFQKMVEGKIVSFSNEKRYRHKNGLTVWVKLTISKMVTKAGESLHFIGVIEDITGRKQVEHLLQELQREMEIHIEERTVELEKTNRKLQEEIAGRKQAAEALRLSEEKYRILFEIGSEAVFLVDNITNEIKEANRTAREMVGCSREELLTLKITDLFTNLIDTRETIGKIDRIVSDKITVFERYHRTKNGTIIPVEIYTRNLTGNLRSQNIVAIHDIRERKAVEEKICVQFERLNGLKEIGDAINTNKKIEETLESVLDQVFRQAGVIACSLTLLNLEENCLVSRAVRQQKGSGSFSFDDIRAWQVVNTRQPLHFHTGKTDGDDPANPVSQDNDSDYTWGFPLVNYGKVKGVLEVYHSRGFQPDKEWLDYLETLAGQAAIAIGQNEHLDKGKHANEELISFIDETIAGWSKSLEFKSDQTKGQEGWAPSIALQLAKETGMTEEELIHLRRGIILHDIGNLGIQDYILQKNGPLSPEEWGIMKQHPVYARDILKDIPLLKPALDIPYAHHEKWDGSGYPLGLKGEEIPLGARIFAIVDVWDALLSDRPYRNAWPREKVERYIREQSGIYFDPNLVQVFLRIVASVTPEDGI